MHFTKINWIKIWNWAEKEEKEVLQILAQVSVTKREQEINLDEADFDEKKKINKRKKLILQGLEPEEADLQLEKAAAAASSASGSTSQSRRKRRRKAAAPKVTDVDEAADDS